MPETSEPAGVTPESVLAAPEASVPEHRVVPRPLPHIYEAGWTGRHFAWFYDLFARLDFDDAPLAGWGDRVEAALATVCVPLDDLMGVVGRAVGRLVEPVAGMIGRTAEPLDALLGALGATVRDATERVLDSAGRFFTALPMPDGVRGWVSAVSVSTSDGPTLQTRIRARYEVTLWSAVIASAVVHASAFALWPEMQAEDLSFTAEELTAVEIPPEIEIPPPPSRIARPATPVVASAAVEQDITIAPTTFEENPVGDLPPPPEVTATQAVESAPSFTPFTVGPRVTNSDDVVRMLDTEYPPTLRDSGVGGQVVVWFHIDEEGIVTDTRLFRSSGFDDLDRAALRVAHMVEFSPALNRDRPTPVWIQLPLEFRVR